MQEMSVEKKTLRIDTREVDAQKQLDVSEIFVARNIIVSTDPYSSDEANDYLLGG